MPLRNVSQSSAYFSGETCSRRNRPKLSLDFSKKEFSTKVIRLARLFFVMSKIQENTDCRADKSWSEDGAYRPAQLSHSLQTYYWWQPKLGPQARLAQYQQPGMF